MEVLACPHCNRMFHATPLLLGKAIRCRECRQTFRVPADPSTAELGPEAESPQPEILVAVECIVQGVDGRRCPACSHTFAMQARFVGKRIRCRGCRVPFVVLASTHASQPRKDIEAPPGVNALARDRLSTDSVSVPSVQDPASDSEQEVNDESQPIIHEDGGDLLPVEPAGEPLVVAVRPRACWRASLRSEPFRGPFRSGSF